MRQTDHVVGLSWSVVRIVGKQTICAGLYLRCSMRSFEFLVVFKHSIHADGGLDVRRDDGVVALAVGVEAVEAVVRLNLSTLLAFQDLLL